MGPKRLADYHTKQLLKMLREIRVRESKLVQNYGPGPYCILIGGPPSATRSDLSDAHEVGTCHLFGEPHWCWNADQIKAELATREHVPNKIEAKEVRRRRVWEQRHR